ncbi:MAG: hypothetical protein E7626_06660 [Ruminococcaceae bacterium]|nr:hypothetical protein [Oscillospiraceae bacterium]
MKTKVASILAIILVVTFVLASCSDKPTFEDAAKTLQDEITGWGSLSYEITEVNLTKTLIITFDADKYGSNAIGMAIGFVDSVVEDYSARAAELFSDIDDCCVIVAGVSNGKVINKEVLFSN